jgi:hypothetical protein
MTNFEYLNIPKRKTMEKATMKEIKAYKINKKEAMRINKQQKLGFTTKQTTQ